MYPNTPIVQSEASWNDPPPTSAPLWFSGDPLNLWTTQAFRGSGNRFLGLGFGV